MSLLALGANVFQNMFKKINKPANLGMKIIDRPVK
jgi:hypothetical protein